MHSLFSSISRAGALLLAAGLASAQNYPNKPVHVITSDAGGGSDIVSRAIGQALTPALGQQVVVENKGGGVLAGIAVKGAAPDGYTLLFYGATLWLLPLMRNGVPYDALRDFVPITMAVTTPAVLTVHPSLPVKSVKDLISLAKSHPGQLNYGSPAVGTSTHLAAELLKSMAGVDMTHIPFKGAEQSVPAILSGNIMLMLVGLPSVQRHVKSGKLRIIAVADAERSPLMPEVPTIAESGFSGYKISAEIGFLAPAGTPKDVIAKLNREIVQALKIPDIAQQLSSMGIDPVGSTPEEYASTIRRETAKWGKLIRDLGIKEE